MNILPSAHSPRGIFVCALLGLLALAATPWIVAAGLPSADEKQIRQVIADYRDAWLADDRAKVLGLLAEDATIVPSERGPIRGLKAITEFWFPPADGSKTSIDHYEIDLLEVSGSGELAYTLESGRLTWSYEKDGRKTTTSQESNEITIFRKTDGRWKILRRLWADHNVKRTGTTTAKKAS